MKAVKIGNRFVGDGNPCFIVAEIGINHNGSIQLALELINVAKESGCDAVKFQKRTVDVVYSKEELEKPRESFFGDTNGDLKNGLEFGKEHYKVINDECKRLGIMWFASCWDEASVDFVDTFGPPCYKIASASITDDSLLKHHLSKNKPIILSTGMSTIDEIEHAVSLLDRNNLIILHCNSTYPSKSEELNLSCIKSFERRFRVPIGYSGHEVGLQTTIAAATLGACIVERHITLDRSMWGSDQAASVEPQGMRRIVRDIREVEKAMGDGIKKVYDSEIPIREKLRRV